VKSGTDLTVWQRLLEGIWPQERDLFLRPDRWKYVRKLVPSDGCVFCAARDRALSPQSLCLYQNRWAMVVLNKFPYNTGHLMVLPKRHTGQLLELSEEEYLATQSLLRKSLEFQQKEYGPAGFNIGLNHGAVAGAGIPDHLHWHVIPRWAGDTNFLPLIAETKIVPETLEQTYSRLKPYFDGLPVEAQ
jgi:ATP adenylyltransferase